MIDDWYLTGTTHHKTNEEALNVARESNQICMVRNKVVNYFSSLPIQHKQQPFELTDLDLLIEGNGEMISKTGKDFIEMAKPAVSEAYLDNSTKDLATARQELTRLQTKIVAAQLAFDKGYQRAARECLGY